MSAQRRTTAPKQSLTAPPPAKPAAPVVRAPKPAGDRGKPATAQPSAIALRTEAFQRLVRDTWAEMKKINWPDQQTTRSLTVLVIGISIALGILLGGIDFILLKLLNLF